MRLFLSDLHIGDVRSQYRKALVLIQQLKPSEIYLVGDIFDLWTHNWDHLENGYFAVFSFFKNLSEKGIKIIYILGNHEDDLDISEDVLNAFIIIPNSYEFKIGEKKVKIIHGHQYDDLLKKYYWFFRIADPIRNWLLKIGFDWSFLKVSFSSLKSKKFFSKALIELEDNAIQDNKDSQILIMGHTHIRKEMWSNGLRYYNLGCWLEESSYLIEDNEKFELKTF
jgi:UDP-2,3-diacylglucosamine pyrophosphatase LpxH